MAGVALLLLASSIARLGSVASPPRLLDDLASPYSWCDAADAYDARGQSDKAAVAYRRAVVLGSHEAPVLLRAANFQLTQPDPASALPLFARLLQLVPNYDAPIFSTYDAMRFNVDLVLRSGLPADRRAAQAYFGHLLTHQASVANLARVWQWLEAHAFRDERLAGLYAGYLLAARQYPEALAMWAGFAGPFAPRNCVFNGGFETAPKPSPLDWSIASDRAQRIASEPYAGLAALQIHFTGTANDDFHDVSQSLIVSAGPYRLEASVKTSGITTDEGIRLHLFDAEQPARLQFWTESFTGTRPWTRLAWPVPASPRSRLLTLQICRRPSSKIDKRIAGTAWIDAIALVPRN